MRELLGAGGMAVIVGAVAFYGFWQAIGRALYNRRQLGRDLRRYGLGRR